MDDTTSTAVAGVGIRSAAQVLYMQSARDLPCLPAQAAAVGFIEGEEQEQAASCHLVHTHSTGIKSFGSFCRVRRGENDILSSIAGLCIRLFPIAGGIGESRQAMETTESEQHTLGGAAASAPAMRPTCPPWLQAAIADIEQRVRSLAVSAPDESATDHSFAERAENYYQKRPQLLTLLTDMHHRYLYLADRYSQSLAAKNLHAVPVSDCSSDVDDRSSDAGSSLSFQQPLINCGSSSFTVADASSVAVDAELLVAELVVAWVDRDVLANEAERRRTEAARKIELQGSLVEVLESERLVLLGENARLGFRASAAEEEAAAAAAELGYMRRRATEMARLVVKLREDHRVCMLGRKIEALQAQVYGLELRNRECYETMAAWEAERKVGAAELERLRMENRRLAAAAMPTTRRGKKKGTSGGWWWSRVGLAAEWTPCAPSVREQMKGKGGGCFCV